MATDLGRTLGTTLGTWIDSSDWQSWPLAADSFPTEGNVIYGAGNYVLYGGDQVVV